MHAAKFIGHEIEMRTSKGSVPVSGRDSEWMPVSTQKFGIYTLFRFMAKEDTTVRAVLVKTLRCGVRTKNLQLAPVIESERIQRNFERAGYQTSPDLSPTELRNKLFCWRLLHGCISHCA